jgi:hypothetical protein
MGALEWFMTGLPFTMACREQDEYQRWRALDNACLPASGCSFWDAAPLPPPPLGS